MKSVGIMKQSPCSRSAVRHLSKGSDKGLTLSSDSILSKIGQVLCLGCGDFEVYILSKGQDRMFHGRNEHQA